MLRHANSFHQILPARDAPRTMHGACALRESRARRGVHVWSGVGNQKARRFKQLGHSAARGRSDGFRTLHGHHPLYQRGRTRILQVSDGHGESKPPGHPRVIPRMMYIWYLYLRINSGGRQR